MAISAGKELSSWLFRACCFTLSVCFLLFFSPVNLRGKRGSGLSSSCFMSKYSFPVWCQGQDLVL